MQKKPISMLIAAFIALALSIGACTSEGQENTSEEMDSTQVVLIDTVVVAEEMPQDTLITIETPLLEKAMAGKPAVISQYTTYKALLANPNAIIDDQAILEVLSQRNDLINAIQYEVLEHVFYETIPAMANAQEAEDSLLKELNSIGLEPVYAEGSYTGLADGIVLAEQIEKVASEPLKIYLAFRLAYANSLGSEYTYLDLQPEIEMVAKAEELLTKHPQSEYIQRIIGNYEEALLTLTDVHTSEESLLVGGLQTEAYPNATDFSNFQLFKEKYSMLKLWKVVAKIQENISNLNGEATDTLHIISIKKFDDASQARGAALTAIKSGRDIPHVLPISTPEGLKHLLAYRFYTDSAKAKVSLVKAQVMKPEATRIKAKYQQGTLILIE